VAIVIGSVGGRGGLHTGAGQQWCPRCGNTIRWRDIVIMPPGQYSRATCAECGHTIRWREPR